MLAFSATTTFGAIVVRTADRAAPFQATASEIALFARETCARAMLSALRPLRSLAPRIWARASEEASRTPTLLVPDLESHALGLLFLAIFLRHRGWHWLGLARPAAAHEALAVHAEAVAQQIEALCAASRAQQVDVVAHGRGGLAVAWYLRHRGGAARVRRLVTLGTPWAGNRLAAFTRSDALRSQTLPGAHALDDLAPPPVPSFAVWSPDDPGVVPAQSACPAGVEPIRLDHTGHSELLFSARAYRAVQAALTLPLPGAQA